MGKETGFKEFERKPFGYKPVEERVKGYSEFTIPLTQAEVEIQGARCMNCGVPFCHNGCPVGNIIPDFNDLVWQGDWKRAPPPASKCVMPAATAASTAGMKSLVSARAPKMDWKPSRKLVSWKRIFLVIMWLPNHYEIVVNVACDLDCA